MRFETVLRVLGMAICISACVPTVDEALRVGKPLSSKELQQFSGAWKSGDMSSPVYIHARVDASQLVFDMREDDGSVMTIPVTVQELSQTAYIFNADVTKIAPQLSDKSRRFVPGIASYQNGILAVRMMQEEALLKLVRQKAYTGSIENACTGKKVLPTAAKRPPEMVTDPCFHLRPDRQQLLALVASHATSLYAGQSTLTLSRN
jgi:hypothetical protein